MGCLVNIHLRSGDHSNAVCEVVEGKDNAEARRVLEHAGIWWRGGIGRVKTLDRAGVGRSDAAPVHGLGGDRFYGGLGWVS